MTTKLNEIRPASTTARDAKTMKSLRERLVTLIAARESRARPAQTASERPATSEPAANATTR
jgi:hypothetical protein